MFTVILRFKCIVLRRQQERYLLLSCSTIVKHRNAISIYDIQRKTPLPMYKKTMGTNERPTEHTTHTIRCNHTAHTIRCKHTAHTIRCNFLRLRSVSILGEKKMCQHSYTLMQFLYSVAITEENVPTCIYYLYQVSYNKITVMPI